MLAKLQAVWPQAEAAATCCRRRCRTPTPGIDAVITLASIVLGTDFRAQGKRLPRNLGFGDLTPERVAAL